MFDYLIVGAARAHQDLATIIGSAWRWMLAHASRGLLLLPTMAQPAVRASWSAASSR